MKNWMSRCAALIGTVLSLSSFAQVCQEVSLYKGDETGKLEQVGSTFPEFPEWQANWGTMDGMTPPYIRFSGMKNDAGDWTGLLSFDALPKSIRGGYLKAKVRSTQKARIGFWLKGSFGTSQIYFKSIEANKTVSVEIPVSALVGESLVQVDHLGLGIFDVAAYQYTTLFVDDLLLTCEVKSSGVTDSSSETEYTYSDVTPSSPERQVHFVRNVYPETSMAYSVEERQSIANSTSNQIVISEMEQNQIESFMAKTSMEPVESRNGWRRNMYFLDRNRLKDSVIANPRALLYEAETFSANNGNREMPILIGNVDYGYSVCADTACATTAILNARLLQAGLPTASVGGSKIRLHYDPYFVSTNRKSLPTLQVYAKGVWNDVSPKSHLDLEFESAGVQKIQVKLSEGGVEVNQNLFVEVE